MARRGQGNMADRLELMLSRGVDRSLAAGAVYELKLQGGVVWRVAIRVLSAVIMRA